MYVAAVRPRDRADNGEPQTEALVARPDHAPSEPLEDDPPVLIGYAGARVAHPHPRCASVVRRPDGDDVALAGVLHGVFGQRQHRLRDPLLVKVYEALGTAVESPIPVAQGARLRQHGLGDAPEIGRHGIEEVRPLALRE